MKKFATSLLTAVLFFVGFNATAWAVVDAGGVNLLGGGNGGAGVPNNGGAGVPNNGGNNQQPTYPAQPAGGDNQGAVVTLTHDQANTVRTSGRYITGSSAQPSADGSGVWVDSINCRNVTGRSFAAGNTDQFGNPTSGGDLEGLELGPDHTESLGQPFFVPNDPAARAGVQASLTNYLASLNANLGLTGQWQNYWRQAWYTNPDPNAQAAAMEAYQSCVNAANQIQGQIAATQLRLAAMQ